MSICPHLLTFSWTGAFTNIQKTACVLIWRVHCVGNNVILSQAFQVQFYLIGVWTVKYILTKIVHNSKSLAYTIEALQLSSLEGVLNPSALLGRSTYRLKESQKSKNGFLTSICPFCNKAMHCCVSH